MVATSWKRLAAVSVLLTAFGGYALAQAVTPKAVTPLVWKPLGLHHGWQPYGNGTRAPAVAIDPNTAIVYLRGAMHQPTGSNPNAFTLPGAYRPGVHIYLPINCLNTTTGRLHIDDGLGIAYSNGTVAQVDCQNFTSLDGITFAKQ